MHQTTVTVNTIDKHFLIWFCAKLMKKMLGGDENKFVTELRRLLFQKIHAMHVEALLETLETFPISQSVWADISERKLKSVSKRYTVFLASMCEPGSREFI